MTDKLAKTAARGAAEKRKLAAKGKRAAAVVKRKKTKIERSFYEMGKALVVLEDPGVFHAMGYSSFDALCSTHLGVPPATADRLIHIVESFPASEARKLNSTKATALIDLARAMGGRTTARGLLARGTVHVGHTTLDVKSANATKIAAVAKDLRDGKHASGPGVHVSAEDARFVKHLDAKMHAEKIEGSVSAAAAAADEGAKMHITCHVREAKALEKALSAALRGA